MYLRTTSRTNRDGSRVAYYQLAHNRWDPERGCSVAEVVHNFGRADELDRQELVRLARSIARVCGLTVVDPVDLAGQNEQAPFRALLDGVRLVKTRPLGPAAAIEGLWEQLGVGPAIRGVVKAVGASPDYERALLAMTANRLCEPESKLGVWQRWLERQHLPTCWGLRRDDIYEAMDLLQAHSAAIEQEVFFRTADLLNLDVDLVFYDTTTVSVTVDDEDEEPDGPRRRGRGKEGGWPVQIVVALAVTRAGIPVRSWVLPGNTADVATVERVKADLRGWKLGRALFVADSRFNAEDTRETIARACGRYVLATRMGAVKEVGEQVLARAGRYKTLSDDLQVKEVVVGEGERRRRYVVCFNPAEAERQRRHRTQVIEELQEELKRHPQRSATAKWAIELQASGRYGRYVKADGHGRLIIDRAAVRQLARHDGKWVLITNDDTLSVEDAAASYKGLQVVERCFRTLKTAQLRIRPMHHRLAERIEAHVKICVLALLIEHAAEHRCGKPWARILDALEGLQASEFHGRTHRFFHRNEVPDETRSALESLAIPMPKTVFGVEPLPA